MDTKRRYSREGRDEQIAQSRRHVLNAAAACFLTTGYAATTVATIAARAGVSVQTVYNVVGGKAELLKAVYDTTLAGDDEPIPMAQRPQMQAILAAADARSCLLAYAALGRTILERTAPLLARVIPEATGDPAIQAFAEAIERERYFGATNMARHVQESFGLKPGLDISDAADSLWALTAPELAHRLANQRDWGWERYQEWLGDVLSSAITGPTTWRPDGG
ncbi:TetR/AcrR family transcriptional regulator [Branchiibius cervicis]|uniref:TetR/AcrR family transcriptional regulator n=1 Tax=Branchiibius cervicis TaxID=908252 RepID=A0ABW2AR82_9MICO